MKLIFSLSLFAFCGFSNLFGQQSAFPITLSNPMDYDTIIETEPNFIWQTNITALQTDPRYSQRYLLCDLLENQQKGEAIVVNTPILVLEDYQNTIYSYTSTNVELLPGHTYVWQLSILFNGMIVDQSEPYQFTILKPKNPIPVFYPLAYKNDGQTYQVINNQIGLATDETGDLKLTVQIYQNGRISKSLELKDLPTDKEKEQKSEQKEEKKPSSGKRFLILDLKESGLEKGYYSAVWAPKSKKSFTFNFKID